MEIIFVASTPYYHEDIIKDSLNTIINRLEKYIIRVNNIEIISEVITYIGVDIKIKMNIDYKPKMYTFNDISFLVKQLISTTDNFIYVNIISIRQELSFDNDIITQNKSTSYMKHNEMSLYENNTNTNETNKINSNTQNNVIRSKKRTIRIMKRSN